MKVLVLSNGKFIEKEIENTLEALQTEVDGLIEIPYLSEELNKRKIDMIINEEGKLIDGLNMELAVVTNHSQVIDIIFGNIVFASNDEEGNTIGLDAEQITFIKDFINQSAFVNGEVVRVLWI